MVNEVDPFWPEELKGSVRSPLSVLRGRAAKLTELTHNLLVGSVKTSESATKEDWTVQKLIVAVPALKDFRKVILEVEHANDQFYPCIVNAQGFPKPKTSRERLRERELRQKEKPENEANSDGELELLLKSVVSLPQIKALLFSLKASAEEALGKEVSAK